MLAHECEQIASCATARRFQGDPHLSRRKGKCYVTTPQAKVELQSRRQRKASQVAEVVSQSVDMTKDKSSFLSDAGQEAAAALSSSL